MLGSYDFKTRALTRFDEISFFSLSLDSEKKKLLLCYYEFTRKLSDHEKTYRAKNGLPVRYSFPLR